MSATTAPRNGVALFATTVFTSAFLLFQVQPLLAKFILPWFGGTPAVWTMCMLVFQLLLFGGYAYAHLLSRVRSTTTQACIHAGLLAVAAITLPIAPDASWKPIGTESPGWRITLLLLSSVGVPYFLLSSTGPLLQRWFTMACPGASPWRLYALSNCGSLLALLSYPFLVEPALTSTAQAWVWSVLFVVFALSCLACGWTTAVYSSVCELHRGERGVSRVSLVAQCRWFMLALTPSIMLLATTNEVCMDIAVVPFLWIIPLTLYLLSFIFTFECARFYSGRTVTLLTAASLAVTALMMVKGDALGIVTQIAVYFTNLFFVCMLCHGELYARKPDTQHLTAFYLTMSAGGAAGGLLVGLIAPLVFKGYHELPVGMTASFLICVGSFLRREQRFSVAVPDSLTLKFGAFATALLALFGIVFPERSPGTREMTRNFYGVLRVEDETAELDGRPVRAMVHGRVVHGRQFLDDAGRRQPATYYSQSSGIGRILNQPPVAARHVGVVGLGAGTLAAYGHAGDRYRFYEINPDVIRLANDHFTFLSDCPSEVQVLPGDARLVLEREKSQQFDVLALDAFSGDAIPVHLLTAEAMQIYHRHLKPDGVLAVHISNSYFDLEPVVTALAHEFGLHSRMQKCGKDADDGLAVQSVWMLLSRDSEALITALGPEPMPLREVATVLWTDDRNNLLNVLR